MDLEEEITIPKYELIMVLKENENLRHKTAKYKHILAEMRDKSCNSNTY